MRDGDDIERRGRPSSSPSAARGFALRAMARFERFAATRLPLATCLLLIAGIAWAMHTDRRPSHYFKEGRPFTLLSTGFLGVVAGIALDVALRRPGGGIPDATDGSGTSPSVTGDERIARRERIFWGMVSFGFAFLAFDEVACIHEKAGDWLTRLVYGKWKDETTEQVSDSVVAFGYLFAALAVVGAFRRELVRYRAFVPQVAVALLCGAVSMGMDFSTDDPDFVKALEAKGVVWRNAILALDAAEDFFKLMAGALMVRAFTLLRRFAVGAAANEARAAAA